MATFEVPILVDRSAVRPDFRPAHEKNVRALLVSPEWEVRRVIVRILEGIGIDMVTCSTTTAAEEALFNQPFDVVFCDEYLPDGSYADLLLPNRWESNPRVIVVTRVGEWDLYIDALSKGAFDVVRAPWHAADVEIAVLHALRDRAKERLAAGESGLDDLLTDNAA